MYFSVNRKQNISRDCLFIFCRLMSVLELIPNGSDSFKAIHVVKFKDILECSDTNEALSVEFYQTQYQRLRLNASFCNSLLL